MNLHKQIMCLKQIRYRCLQQNKLFITLYLGYKELKIKHLNILIWADSSVGRARD